jgi:hypothetical protein
LASTIARTLSIICGGSVMTSVTQPAKVGAVEDVRGLAKRQ